MSCYTNLSSSQMVKKEFQSICALNKTVFSYYSYSALKQFHKPSWESILKEFRDPLRLLCRKFRPFSIKTDIEKKPDWMEIFTCKCGFILHDPCTLPCGHTICRQCFKKAEFCIKCGGTSSKQFILNVTFAGLLERWFPDQYRAADLKLKARKFIEEEKYEKAIEVLSQCLKQNKEDSITLCLRAEAYLKTSKTKQAYRDVRKSCKLNPECGEALFILGAVCASLNKLDSAVEAYQKCLECHPDDSSLYGKVCHNLDELLSMPLGDEVEVSDEEEEIQEVEKPNHEEVTEYINPNFSCKKDIPKHCDTDRENVVKNVESNATESNYVLSSEESNTRKRKIPQMYSAVDKSYYNKNIKTHDCANSDTSRTLFVDNTPGPSSKPDIVKLPCKRNCPSTDETENSKNCEKEIETGSAPQLDDFECKLCFNIFYQPVTTPCGHVFCRACLERCIDHNPSCPICRNKLEYQETGVGNATSIIEKAAEYYFPKEFSERIRKQEEYIKLKSRVGIDESEEVPIFPCVLVLPTIQSQFHIFEPKYRLMLRECLQSGSRRFGICQSNKDGGHCNYGTIVEVKIAKFLPDGRSIIDIVGERRFKIADSHVSNGIANAKVEFFEDNIGLYQTDNQREQLANKCMAVYNQLSDYIGKLHPSEKECIFSALGPIPAQEQDPWELPNGLSWLWWAIAALPLNDKVKLVVFKSQSLLERVTILHRFLQLLSKVRPNIRPEQQAIET